jgi:hypothetical protein
MKAVNDAWYSSISTYQSVQELIANGETEGVSLECKNLSSSRLDPGLRKQIAKTVSAFSNSAGGVLLLGVGTDKSDQGVDRLTQIHPIGNIDSFTKALKIYVPSLTNPTGIFTVHTLKKKKSDSKGIAAILVSPSRSDPVKVIDDDYFYRVGASSVSMPAELIRRMFLSSNESDLHIVHFSHLVKRDPKTSAWKLPVIVTNKSSAIGEDVLVRVKFNNDHCSVINTTFTDQSNYNKGKTVYSKRINSLVYRGLDRIVGFFSLQMKKGTQVRRSVDMSIEIFARGMRAREERFNIHLTKGGFTYKLISDRFLY